MLYFANGAIAKIQFLDIFNLVYLSIFEERGNLKDLIVKGIQKELIFLSFQCIFDYFIVVQCSKQSDIGSQKCLLDERPTNGARYWIIVIPLEHAPDADIAEVVRVGTCKCGPFAQDMILLVADITEVAIRALAYADGWDLLLFAWIAVVFFHVCSI